MDKIGLDLDKFGLNGKMNPGPETGLKAQTKYDVYSCPSLPFSRIENRAKIKKIHILFGKLDFREKILKE